MTLKKHLLLFAILSLITFSCNQPPENDVYKTTSKEYASRSEKWILKFPKLPEIHRIKTKMGDLTFNVKSYNVSLAGDEHFTLNLMNYPESMLRRIPKEELYRNSVNAVIDNSAMGLSIDRFEDVTDHNIPSKRFEIGAIRNRRSFPRIHGKIIVTENQVLSVIYVGMNEEKADEFLTSFKRF